jgi:hypothetical protein
LIAIALGMAVMFALLIVVSFFQSPLGSLVGVSLACAAGLIVISRRFYTRYLGRSFTAIVLLVFVLKIIIGIWHYLYFFEPNYFNAPLGYFPWAYDFGQLPEGMQSISSFWHMYGFVDVPRTQIVEKSWILAVYHALLYYFSGEYFLNFVPWTSFHTLLVGFLVSVLALQSGATGRQATIAFVLASLQPLFLYTDLPQRDIVGQFFVVLAVYLALISYENLRRLMVVLPLALVLVYAQRWAYPFVIVGAVLLAYILSKHRYLLATMFIGILVSLWSQAGSSFLELTIGKYGGRSGFSAEDLPITSITHIPAAILVGLIGPFPWTQVFSVQNAFIHLPPNFIQSWLGLIIWSIAFPRIWRQWKTTKTLNSLAIYPFLFTLSGMMTSATHVGYVHIATVMLLPMTCQASKKEWLHKTVIVSFLYFIGHILFFGMGFSGAGSFIR